MTTDSLVFEHEDLLPLTERWVWVSVKRFRIRGELSDEAVFATLVGLPQFQDCYQVPMSQGWLGFAHGPYGAGTITPSAYEAVSARAAMKALNQWALNTANQDLNDWTPVASKVLALLSEANLYRLRPLPDSAHHDTWFVVGGSTGFIEFVAIKPAESCVLLVVASEN